MTVLIAAWTTQQELEETRAFVLRRYPDESVVEDSLESCGVDGIEWNKFTAVVTPAIARRNRAEDSAVVLPPL